MTTDHAILMRDITQNLNSALASFGFGTVMATFAILALVRAGAKPGRFTISIIFAALLVFCMSWAQWAQGLRFIFDAETVKIFAVVAACTTLGLVVLRMIERAPPSAMLAGLAVMLCVCLCAVTTIFAPTKNMALFVALVAIVAFAVICAIVGFVFVRVADRRPIMLPHAPALPEIERMPREIDRGPLLAAPRETRALQHYRR